MTLAVWLAGLLLLVGLGAAEAAVQVEMAGDRLTVTAENTALRDILQAVADAGHFSLRIEPSLADPITVQFQQRPVLEVLDGLLRDQNMLIRYTRTGRGVRVEDVQVLAPSPPRDRTERAGLGNVWAPGASPAPVGEAPVPPTIPPGSSPSKRMAADLTSPTGDQAEAGQAVLADLLNGGGDPNFRQQVLVALGPTQSMPLVDVASAALTEDDPAMRLLALTLLAERAHADDPTAQGILQGIASQDEDVEIRRIATALLGES